MNNYRLDDLQNGYKLYQDETKFCYGVDSVLLADFVAKNISSHEKVLDLCTGSAVIPILIYARKQNAIIDAVEIDEDTANMAKENIKLNNLDINIINSDINYLEHKIYHTVCVNPPYIPIDRGILNPNNKLSIAKHEVHCTLDDVVRIASKSLNDKGKFFIVHKAHRTNEIMETMKKYNITPKLLQFVHPKLANKASLVLASGTKSGGEWVDILEPIVIRNDDNTYTRQLNEIYSR